MVLLERDLPLTSLADYGDQARRGDGRVVLVAGEAGVGKSALLGDRAPAFSSDVRAAVLDLHPAGVVTEPFRIEVLIAARP